MEIRYNFKENFYNFSNDDLEEGKNLSFLMTNAKGDFLNLGVEKNITKFQGLNIFEKNDIFKIIDSIIPENLEVKNIIYEGFKVKRIFKSRFTEDVLIEEEGEKKEKNNDLKIENINEDSQPYDTFYLGPNGGLVYEIENFEGVLKFFLDMRKMNDFDKWGRDYTSFKEDNILFMEYKKKTPSTNQDEYKLYLGIKTQNFDYILKNEWIENQYPYSKKRNSLYDLYIYNFVDVNISGSKRLIIGAGISKEQVKSQIELLEKHEADVIELDREMYDELTKEKKFELPIPENISVANRISNYSIYRFIRQDFKTKEYLGLVAGYPWFPQIWTRDELISLRAFINNGEYHLVKTRLLYYLDLIDEKTGELPRINIEGALKSVDGTFWLAKRFEDLIFHLDEKKELEKYFSDDELNKIYDEFLKAFNNIVNVSWDKNEELLRVKKGDSWMDTIEVNFPLDIQVQFLNFTSCLSFLAQILDRKEKIKLNEFEFLLKSKIRSVYFRDGRLFQEKDEDKLTSNIFLAYYLYPDLLLNEDWERIFDNSLLLLTNETGLISTLSKKDTNFKENYTGEDNLSYHNGDAWFWINNIAAMSMNHLNEKKYRKYISKILYNSTLDILENGVLGFASELSSASKLKAEGNQAQLWSSSTYLEMIDFIFKRK